MSRWILGGRFQVVSDKFVSFLGKLVQALFRSLRPEWKHISNEVAVENLLTFGERSSPSNNPKYLILVFPLFFLVRGKDLVGWQLLESVGFGPDHVRSAGESRGEK